MNKRDQAKRDKANASWQLVDKAIHEHEQGIITLKQGDMLSNHVVLDVNLHTITLVCTNGPDKGYQVSKQLAWIDANGNNTHIGDLVRLVYS